MARRPRGGGYGIAELYGKLYRATATGTSRKLIEDGEHDCPHLVASPKIAPKSGSRCRKESGVCSIRKFIDDGAFGPITTTCPNRFLDGGIVLKEIAKTILGVAHYRVAKEIPFLKRADSEEENGEEDVGRIDLVCATPEGANLNWCAVEMQAVYFSGANMKVDFDKLKAYDGNSIPGPGGQRRPDFRSSGPKRLMPQLQIKVPSLRRWGKKMIVVVDKEFFSSLGEMDDVGHVSNADIVWLIVGFDEDTVSARATLKVEDWRYTTLERAVEGLTAGHPTTLPEFENKLLAKLQ